MRESQLEDMREAILEYLAKCLAIIYYDKEGVTRSAYAERYHLVRGSSSSSPSSSPIPNTCPDAPSLLNSISSSSSISRVWSKSPSPSSEPPSPDSESASTAGLLLDLLPIHLLPPKVAIPSGSIVAPPPKPCTEVPPLGDPSICVLCGV